MISAMLKLKLAVTDTPVINGFSYPFLRLLVIKAMEMKDGGKLFIEDDVSNPGRAMMPLEAVVVMNQIATQLLESSDWSTRGSMVKQVAFDQIDAAESLLNIFVATDAELMEMSRTPEKP